MVVYDADDFTTMFLQFHVLFCNDVVIVGVKLPIARLAFEIDNTVHVEKLFCLQR